MKEQLFEDYLREARDEFVMEINSNEWNTKVRTAAESFLICFDQLKDRFLASPPVDNIRWVRASKRFPEDDMFEDFPQHHIVRYKDDGSRGMFHGGSATYDQLKEIMKEWDYVEWLEEQTNPVDNIVESEEKNYGDFMKLLDKVLAEMMIDKLIYGEEAKNILNRMYEKLASKEQTKEVSNKPS